MLKSVLNIITFGVLITAGFLLLSLRASERPFTNAHVHHDIAVALHPSEHRFVAEDSVTVPDNFPGEFGFLLHKGLNPESRSENVSIVKEATAPANPNLESYRVRLPRGMRTFVLRYGGIIDHPLEPVGKEQARGYSQTMGKIAGEGVYLSGHACWYPVLDTAFVTFSLTVDLPQAWDAVSQGERTLHRQGADKTKVRWTSPEPQEEIYLVAGTFHEYSREVVRPLLPQGAVAQASRPRWGKGESAGDNIQAMVFLRSPDRALADKYLLATARYITMYEDLIGFYPYKKFALVENFWETGFGMPSFTLLGPKVIRFPFIITTSYPHEILHTWWGNSVFPDYREGNWSEGLTAYLSDHLNAEQRGEDKDYRQTTLQKYTDYVSGGKDFPLTEFRSRHSSTSEAIGYGKSLMFFHMLRGEVGDEMFIEGLREFYRENRFRYASFHDLRKSFEHVTGKKWDGMFAQWIRQSGAPELKISRFDVRADNDHKYIVTLAIEQTQKGQPYRLLLPVAVTMEGKEQTYQTSLVLEKKQAAFAISLNAKPLRIDVDSEFDVFRRLDRDEIPPAITQVLGAEKLFVILPNSVKPSLLRAYRTFAEVLGNAGPEQVEIKLDREISAFPSGGAVCVLGTGNRFFGKVLEALERYELQNDQKGMRIVKSSIPYENHSIVLTGRNPANQDAAMMFITSDSPEALKGLSRKLPHYHKYSYLAFAGDDPQNILKGRWPVADSPMTVFLPDKNGSSLKVAMGRLNKRKPLVADQQDFSAGRMMETVRFLASDEMKGRASGSPEINRVAEYIAQQFREAGLEPAGDGGSSFFQTWVENGQPDNKSIMKNIVGVIPGKNPEWSSQSIVVGAHYDHLGTSISEGGRIDVFHGADDNASGVAVLIEVARVLGQTLTPERSVVFVSFDGEESARRGSQYYIRHMQRYPKEQIIGMLNIDTVGRLDKDRLLVLGSGSAKEWEHIFQRAGYMTGLSIQLVPEELDASDQKSFQQAGVPAVQFFTGPHLDYHKPSDTAEKINADGLTKVASVTQEVIRYLSERKEALTVLTTADRQIESEPKKARKVSFGIIPDFGYQGLGCRVAGIVQGSPAEKSGLREGDIIVGINARVVHKLGDFSDVLRALNPGDKVRISYLREGKEMTADAELSKRK